MLRKFVDPAYYLCVVEIPCSDSDALPICLIDIIQKFDATLHSAMIEKMREMDPKPWSEFTKDSNIPRFLGMKEMSEHDLGPIMRRNDSGHG